jgi:disulfide bond formation protein DsbB
MIMNSLYLFHSRRSVLTWVALACLGMLAFGFYLQHVVGLEPCPMCIVQRYCLVLVGLAAALGATRASRGRGSWQRFWAFILMLLCWGGAFVAARQSYLQWFPPEVMTCGRDFYGMIEAFPLQRALPMIFKGSGDCSQVDWTFLGGSIANWSFLCFMALGFVGAYVAFASRGFKR